MFDQNLLDAVARSMAIHFSMNRQPHMSGDPLQRLGSQELRRLTDATQAALEALCEARPDVAAVLAGLAVAVPPLATERMLWAADGATPPQGDWDNPDSPEFVLFGLTQAEWQQMVTASPFVTTTVKKPVPRQGYISPELLTSLQDYSDSLDKTKVNEFLELYRTPSQDPTS